MKRENKGKNQTKLEETQLDVIAVDALLSLLYGGSKWKGKTSIAKLHGITFNIFITFITIKFNFIAYIK